MVTTITASISPCPSLTEFHTTEMRHNTTPKHILGRKKTSPKAVTEMNRYKRTRRKPEHVLCYKLMTKQMVVSSLLAQLTKQMDV